MTPTDELVQSSPIAASTLERGWRGLRGRYSVTQLGRLAVDGNVLNEALNHDYVAASAWHSPACQFCWRPEIVRMVPPDRRWCPRHGTPTLPEDDPYEMAGDELARARERAWKHLATAEGVPLKHQAYAFETSERTPAIEVADRYRNGDLYLCGCVILYGRPGCGKTVALRAAFRDAILEKTRDESTEVIRFYDFPRLISLLLDRDARKKTLLDCRRADELILDDLGSSHFKPGTMVQGLVEEIFVHREQHQSPMLASTNLSPKQFRAAFGERVYDRLRGEWGRWVDVDRPSLRRKKA
jgi:DNA replication protein DnaC